MECGCPCGGGIKNGHIHYPSYGLWRNAEREKLFTSYREKMSVYSFRLDSNLETKAESTLSMVKLYEFYTDMCQQDASYVVEMDVFKTVRKYIV